MPPALPVRDKLIRQQTKRLELMNAKAAGRLLEADAVAREWAAIVARVKSRLTAIPARLATAHPGNRPVIETLEAEIAAALRELADD